MSSEPNRRILLVDDNADIHRDFRKILEAGAGKDAELRASALEDALFSDDDAEEIVGESAVAAEFELVSAHQGQEAVERAREALEQGRPFAMTFVDMRMPPGWDGVETIRQLWAVDADLQAVVCTAFADYTWTDMVAELGRTDRLLILKKPFDAIEVCQLATALCEKWDVTLRERKRLEEVVRAEAEARAYAASLETVNRALQQEKNQAEAAARSRSEFLARMTGGILTPVSDLIGDAERALGASSESEDWLEQVEALCRGGRQLSTSLQDVLDLSEMEIGTLALARDTFSPRELAEEVIESVRASHDVGPVELSVECDAATPPTIEADAAHLRRVLQHLVSNAVRYTKQGLVRIAVAGIHGESTRLSFSVIDTGPGLSDEQRKHLFEPFCHSGTGGGDATRGLGLGLHFSMRLAKALGGELHTRPTPGGGTTFVLSLNTTLQRTS